jgi:hypothetical protein
MNTRKMTLNEELFRMKQLFGHMGFSASLITESGPGGPGTGTAIGDAIGSGTGVITKTLGKDVVQSIEYSLYKAAKENSEFLSRIGKTSSDISLDDIRTAFRNSTSDTEALGTIVGNNSTVYNEISNLFVEKLKPKTAEISSADETVKTVKSELELASKNLGTDDNAWDTFADSLVILKQDVETIADQYKPSKTKLKDIIETYETAVNTRNAGKNNNISFNEPIVTTKNIINSITNGDNSKINWSIIKNADNIEKLNDLINSAIATNKYNEISRNGFEAYGIPNFRTHVMDLDLSGGDVSSEMLIGNSVYQNNRDIYNLYQQEGGTTPAFYDWLNTLPEDQMNDLYSYIRELKKSSTKYNPSEPEVNVKPSEPNYVYNKPNQPRSPYEKYGAGSD